MSRSGYYDDWDGDGHYELYRAAVDRAFRGKRGRFFLQQLADAMDAMPEKVLIAGHLMSPEGQFCAMGVVCKVRGIDVTDVDAYDREEVGKLLNIAPSMAAEIAYLNDDDFRHYSKGTETPAERWQRVRKFIQRALLDAAV